MTRARTVLVYACGFNELEPEIARALPEMESSATRNTNVILQISRAPQSLVRAIRRDHAETGIYGDWSGVRRYCLRGGLVERLSCSEEVRMCDPRLLHDFVKWGLSNYPSSLSILLVSGHSSGVFGFCAEYSRPFPGIMPLPHFAAALRSATWKARRCPYLLVLDSCHMDTLEVIYELGTTGGMGGRALLVPWSDSGLSRIRLDRMLEMLGRLDTALPREEVARALIHAAEPAGRSSDAPLLGLVLDPWALSEVRRRFHHLTGSRGIRALLQEPDLIDRIPSLAAPLARCSLVQEGIPLHLPLSLPGGPEGYRDYVRRYPVYALWRNVGPLGRLGHALWQTATTVTYATTLQRAVRGEVRIPPELLMEVLERHNPGLSFTERLETAGRLGWLGNSFL